MATTDVSADWLSSLVVLQQLETSFLEMEVHAAGLRVCRDQIVASYPLHFRKRRPLLEPYQDVSCIKE